MEEEVTKRIEGREFSGILRFPKVMESTLVNTFKDLGDGRTEYRCVVDGKFLSFGWKLMGIFMGGAFKKRQDGDVQRLKEVIERGG